MVDNGDMQTVQNAAVLLMSLGEGDAAEVLKHLEPREVQSIGSIMTQLPTIHKEQVKTVLEAFINDVTDETGLTMGSDGYVRTMLNQALGPEKAAGVMERILMGGNTSGLDTLKWMEPRAVADVIRFEHPQVQAIVLSYLDPEQAAGVLEFLEEENRPDLINRIANLERVQPDALEELNVVIERQIQTGKTTKTTTLGGKKTAANIVNAINSDAESAIMEKLGEDDEDLANEIQELMFVFDNLASLDDRNIQALLREISSDELIVALKGAEEAVKDKVFDNMSKRAAELLKDDLEAKGPVRLSEVEAAQKSILQVARRMADAGEISLGGGGGDEMI